MDPRPAERALDRAMRLLDGVIRALVLVGQLALIGLVGLTVVGVVFRYGLNDPIFGLNDASRMTLLVAVACSLAYGGRQGAHVAVDLLGVAGGRRVTRWTDIAVRLIGIMIVSLTVYALLKQGSCGIRCGHFTPDLFIPFWPFYGLLAFGVGLYGLVLLGELILGLLRFGGPRDPNERL